MLAEALEGFTFSQAVTIYQLGPYGTAAKKFKVWALQP